MTDYLERLAQRTLGVAPSVGPIVASLFEPLHAQMAWGQPPELKNLRDDLDHEDARTVSGMAASGLLMPLAQQAAPSGRTAAVEPDAQHGFVGDHEPVTPNAPAVMDPRAGPLLAASALAGEPLPAASGQDLPGAVHLPPKPQPQTIAPGSAVQDPSPETIPLRPPLVPQSPAPHRTGERTAPEAIVVVATAAAESPSVTPSAPLENGPVFRAAHANGLVAARQPSSLVSREVTMSVPAQPAPAPSAPVPAPARGNAEAAVAEPTISVTIGRVEVRAVYAPAPPSASPSPAPRKSPVMTLEEYLQTAKGGQRE